MAMDSELASLLAALQSADPDTRKPAEAALKSSQVQPGFARRLAAFGADGPSGAEAFPLRQMALVILKGIIKADWARLSAEDQAALRQVLVASLAQESKNLRGLVHACVEQVIKQSSAHWPDLYVQLSAGASTGSAEQAACCVECAQVLLEECDLDVAAALSPLQAPMLHHASSASAPPELRRLCVGTYTAGITAVLSARDGSGPAAHSVLAGLSSWMEVLQGMCVGVEGWSDKDRVACAFCAVRAACVLSRRRALEAGLADSMEQVLRPACLLVQQLGPAYEASVINTDDGGASEDEGGAAELVTQLLELLQSMVVMPKLRPLLKGHVRSMLQLLIPFMRITAAQERSWKADPNEFLQQEEDDHCKGSMVRLSGEGLAGELLSHLRRETCKAVAGIVGELLERGEQARAAGDPNAWKLSEVALFFFGHVSEETSLRLLQRGDLAPVAPKVLTTAGQLCTDKAVPEFLRSRAFAVLRLLGDAVCATAPNELPALMQAAACGLAPAEPLIVRVSACRAFCRFMMAVEDKALCEKILLEQGVLASLGSLVQQADDEMLHLTLESLTLIVKHCPGAIVSVEASLATLVIEIWKRTAIDPLIHMQVLDLVSCAVASDPRLCKAMEERLLPTVLESFKSQEGEEQALFSMTGVDLFSLLLKHAQVPLSPQLWACIEPLIAAVLRSEDSGILQNACDVFCQLVRRAPEQIFEGGMLAPLLQAVERLLRPDLRDDACLFVGPLVTLLLTKFGSRLSAELVSGLLRALVVRLARAQLPHLKQELLVVLGRVLTEDLAGALNALRGLQIPSEMAGVADWTGLQLLLSVWIANAKEIVAKRARNVTVSVLCQLHARLASGDECLRTLELRNPATGELVGLPPFMERLLAVIVAALEYENERCRKLREKPILADDDDDDEGDVEDDEEIEETEGTGSASKVGLLLSELCDSDDDDEDGLLDGADTFQDLERADPLYSIDLRRIAAEHIAACMAAGGVSACAPDLVTRASSAVSEAREHM